MEERKIGWHAWAALEGLSKSGHFVIYGLFGAMLGGSVAFGLFTGVVFGAVELIIFGCIGLARRQSFIPRGMHKVIFAQIAFGVVALYMIAVPIYARAQGMGSALIGFLTAFSVLLAPAFDRLFGDRMDLRGWLGIGFFLLAAWGVADFWWPGDESSEVGLWMVLCAFFPVAAALNELFMRLAGDQKLPLPVSISWIGGTQAFVGIYLMSVFGGYGVVLQMGVVDWAWMALLTFLIIIALVFKFKAYHPEAGGTILGKKILMASVTVLCTMGFDWWLYGDAPNGADSFVIVCFACAVVLVFGRRHNA